jgi:hypothetical protein
MQPVDCKDDENGKVRDKNRKIKGVRLVDASKGVLVECLSEIPKQRIRGKHPEGKQQMEHNDQL